MNYLSKFFSKILSYFNKFISVDNNNNTNTNKTNNKIINSAILSPINDLNLSKQITVHEGQMSYAYQDSLGYWTIGIGRMIDKRKGGMLYPDEIAFLLKNDITRAHNALKIYHWYDDLDVVRQGVLVEMCFEMGVSGLLGFHNMIQYLLVKNYNSACNEIISSALDHEASQDRVNDLIFRLKNGKYQ